MTELNVLVDDESCVFFPYRACVVLMGKTENLEMRLVLINDV